MECAYCGKVFSKRHSLVQHLKNHAKSKTAGSKKFFSVKFSSLTDFHVWKQKVEEETCSYFSTGRRNKCALVTYQYYYCNRSGVFEKRGKGIKRMKSQGTCKVGKKCPAKIITHQNAIDGSVLVKYNLEHNHEVVVEHLRIHKPVRDLIAEKLSEGVPKEKILKDVKENCAQNGIVSRSSLITMKDLTNIARDYNIKRDIQPHTIDTSVQQWVEECKMRSESNPVLYFKDYNADDPLGRFEKKDFVLIIMSQFQKEMMFKFGCDKICVEGTHIPNPYDYTLHTLLIIDEFNNGCPVAFCISNKRTRILYKTFFEFVKENTGSIKSKVFITDDKPAYYIAWQEVMSPSEHYLICTWHLYEDWKKNLRTVPDTETKTEISMLLKILQEETEVDNFKIMLNNFILGLQEEKVLHLFKEYFVNTYSKRSEMWATCYRKHLGLNTNMHLDSLHQRIQHHCLDGTRNRRLDLIIDALLKMIRDFAFQRMMKIKENSVSSSTIKQIDDNHQRSCDLYFNAIPVKEDENMKWSVNSTTRSNVTYTVELIGSVACDCNYLCSACNICIHTFTCSCIHNMINFTICKHIHAVAQNLVFEESSHIMLIEEPVFEIDSNLQEHSSENIISLKQLEEIPTYSSLQTKTENLLRKIMKYKLKDEQKIKEIHQYLDKCLLIFDELKSSRSCE